MWAAAWAETQMLALAFHKDEETHHIAGKGTRHVTAPEGLRRFAMKSTIRSAHPEMSREPD